LYKLIKLFTIASPVRFTSTCIYPLEQGLK